MKRKIFFPYILLISASIIFLSCNEQKNSVQSVAKNDLNDSSYIQIIKNTNAEIEQLMLDSNFDALLTYFTKDILLLPPLSTEIRGIDALRRHYDEQKRRGVKVRAFGGKVEKLWMTDGIVYEYGTYGAAGTVRDLKKPLAQTGYYFMMWEKQADGKFLIKYIIQNLDFNPCE